MRKIKCFMFILLILCLLCGSVNASDNSTDVETSISDVNETMNVEEQSTQDTRLQNNDIDTSYDLLDSSNQEDILSQEDWRYEYDYIQKLIFNKTSGSDVPLVLKKGTYNFASGDGGPGIYINSPIILDGNGSTFTGSDQIFLIKSDNVTLRNINFDLKGNKISTVNIIVQWLGNNAVVENCNFKDIQLTSPTGGAINWRGQNFKLKKTNFNGVGLRSDYKSENNFFKGVMEYTSSGGALSLSSLASKSLGDVEILNCTFNSCSAGTSGGAIYMPPGSDADNFIINNTKFTNCIAGQSSVGIIQSENIAILNTELHGNKDYSHGSVVDDPYSILYLFGKTLLVDNCIFKENMDYRGSGVLNMVVGYNSYDNWNNTIKNCLFEGNNYVGPYAKGLEFQYKGETTVLLSGALLKSHDYLGTMNSYEYGPTVINCNFKENYQSLNVGNDTPGFYQYMVAAKYVINSTFDDNTAWGGTILAPFNEVFNTTFTSNWGNYSIIGTYPNYSVPTGFILLNSTFSDNYADSEGLVCNPKLVNNTIFKSNEVKLSGGALAYGALVNGVDPSTKLESMLVDNVYFYNNRAGNGSGGAIYSIKNMYVIVNNATFINNNAFNDNESVDKGLGGAIHANLLKINNSYFLHNWAEPGRGGAIWAEEAIVNNCSFYNNTAYGDRIGTLILMDETDGIGGAIYACNLFMNNTILDHNEAHNYGGAVFTNGDIRFYNSNFTRNFGPNTLFICDRTPIIQNCTFLFANSDYGENEYYIKNNTRNIWVYDWCNVDNIINNTFDVWDNNLTANQTGNLSNWVLISGFFNPGFNFEIPDLYLENITNTNATGILIKIGVKNNQTIGNKTSNFYNATGLIPGKYVVWHYYKDARGNIYIPQNNRTNVTFYITRYVETSNGTYNTTNATVYFIFAPTEYNNTNWTVFNSTGDIVKKGNNSSFIKYENGYVLNFTDLNVGNYTIYFFVPKDEGYFNITANFTVFKADSSTKINKISNGVFNTTDVIVNLTVVNQTSVFFIINSTTNSSLYNVTLIVKNDGNVTFNIQKGNATYPDINVTSIFNKINQTKNYLINISGLNADKYNITFINNESDNYNSSFADKTFNVLRAPSLINITDVNGIFNTTGILLNVSVVNQTSLSFVIRNATGNCSVNVTFVGEDAVFTIVNKTLNFNNIGFTVNSTSHKSLNYNYTFFINGLNAGIYSISLLNNQSDNYYGFSVNRNLKVVKAGSKVNITNITNSIFNTTDVNVAFDIINQTNVSFVISGGKSKFTVNINLTNNVVNLTIVKKDGEFENVTIISDSFNKNDSNYTYKFIISGLDAGNYTISVDNALNINYNSSSDKTNFTVFKANSKVIIEDSYDGVFNVSGVKVEFSVVNKTTITYFVVNKQNNANFTVISKNGKFEVVNYTSTLNINQFKFNLTKIDEKYVFTLIGIDGGEYNITIFNHENNNYNQSNASATFKVFKTTSLVNITNVTNAIYNTTEAIINVNVINQTNLSFVISNETSNFTVNVNIVNNNVVLTLNKTDEFNNVYAYCSSFKHIGNNYNYTFNIGGLLSNKYNITVHNNESVNYLKSKDNASFEVVKANSSISIVTANGVYNTTDVVVNFVVVNQTDISKVSFVVTNASGKEFIITLNDIKNGVVKTTEFDLFANVNITGIVVNNTLIYNYTFVISGLVAGNYNITIFNNQTRNYNASRNNATFRVYKAPSRVNITAVDGIYNTESVCVNVTVINQTNVSFIIGNGTSNFTINVVNGNLILNKADFINVSITKKAIIEKGLNCTYSFIISGLNAGNYNITGFNGESDNYNSSEFNQLFTVNKASTNVNFTSVTNAIYNTSDVIVNVVVVNQTTVSFIVSNGSDNFTVNVVDGELIVNNGKFNIDVVKKSIINNGLNYTYSFIISGLNAGNYNITGLNIESDNYNMSSDYYNFTVFKANSTVLIDNISNATFNTTNVTFDADIINQTSISFIISNGSVNITVNVTLDNGKVVCNSDASIKVSGKLNSNSGLNYNYSFIICDLNAGNYSLIMLNDENSNYNSSSDRVNFTVSKANSTVEITKIDDGMFKTSDVTVKYHVINETVVTYYIIDKNTKANFTVINNGGVFEVVNYTQGLNVSEFKFKLNKIDNEYIFTILGLDSGNYAITIINNENSNYNSFNITGDFNVVKTTSKVNIGDVNSPIFNTTDVRVNVSIINQTNLSFVIINNTGNLTVNFTIVNNSPEITYIKSEMFSNVNVDLILNSCHGDDYNYTLIISNLQHGLYNLTVNNELNFNYLNSTNSTSFNVSKASSGVDIIPVNGIYDTEDVIVKLRVVNQTDISKVSFTITNAAGDKFNVTFNSITNGIVNIKVNKNQNQFENLEIHADAFNNGLTYEYLIKISGLDVGNYNITAINNETRNYNASKNNNSFNVYKASSNVNITGIQNGIYNASDVIVNVTVINQTSVSFIISNHTANFTVNITVKDNIPIFTIKDPGFENVKVNGALKSIDSKYEYSIVISNLSVNNYYIVFYNDENLNYNESFDKMNFIMDKSNSTVQVSAIDGIFNTSAVDVNISVVNQTNLSFEISNQTTKIIVNVSVVDNQPQFSVVTGDKNIKFDGQVTKSDLIYNYTLSINGLNAGKYNITVFNSNSQNYASSEDNANFIVNKASSRINITANDGIYNTRGVAVDLIVVNQTSSSFKIINNDNKVCEVNVSFNGNVVVRLNDNIGGISISDSKFENGKYTLIVSGLDAGNYNMIATNQESDNYNASKSTGAFTVDKANSTINIVNIVDGIYKTKDVKVTLNVVNKTNMSYTVKFRNGTVVCENISLSDIDFVISDLTTGNYTVVVFNCENSNYYGFMDVANFTVAKATSIVDITNVINGIYDTRYVVVNFDVVNRTEISFVVTNDSDEFTVNLKINDGKIESVCDDDNVEVICNITDQGYEIKIGGLNYGSYEITVINNESSNYNSSQDVEKFNVDKASSTVNVECSNGIYKTYDVIVNFTIVNQTDLSAVYFVLTNSKGEQINISLNSINNENVGVKVNGAQEITVNGHVKNTELTFDYSFVISNLQADNYTVNVYNKETFNYNASSDENTFTVNKASSKIDVHVVDGVYDTVNVVVDLTVINETEVSFNILNDNKICSKVILTHNGNEVISSIDGAGRIVDSKYANGKYSLTIAGLKSGNYDIAVYNNESDNYNSSNNIKSFVVNKASSKIDIVKIIDGIYDTNDAQVIINVINKTNVSYTIKHLNGSIVYENIKISNDEFKISNLNAGNYIICVYNIENENYNASNVTNNFNVARASSNTSINNIMYGIYDTLPVNVTIEIVNETSVEYIITNSNGDIVQNYNLAREGNSVLITGLVPCEYTIEVINKQNINYNSSNAIQSFNVYKAASEVVISPVVNVTFNDKNIIVNYNIYNRTAFEVIVVNKLTHAQITPLIINNDEVIFDLIAVGNYTITINNNGSELYNSSSAVSDFEVYKAGSSVKINPISDRPYSVDKVLVNYGVSNRTGDVELYIYKNGEEYLSIIDPNKDSFNVIPNKNITYTNMSLGSLRPGNYSVTVINMGNENFTESNDTISFTILKASSEVNLTVTDNGLFKINLTEGANGIVTLKFSDGHIEDIVLSNSSKSTALSLPSGNYTVTPYYNGNDNYLNSTGNPVNFTIDNTKQINMTVDVVNPTYPENATIIVTSDVDGDYIVEVNNNTYHVSVKNGKGNITIDQLPLGIYDVNVISNVPNYVVNYKSTKLMVHNGKVSGDAITIDAKDLIRGYNSPYDFKATFYDIYGDVLKNTEVEFIIDNSSYKVMTDNVGVASISLRLNVGQYKVFSRNIKTDEVTLNNLTIVKRLQENKDIVTDYNSGYNYKVLVIDDDGTPVSEGVEFIIPINGKYYSYITDSKGYINVKIDKRFVPSVSKKSLVYTFTLSYKGDAIKNAVTIKQILKTTKKVNVKKSAKKLVLKATLKSSNGKALKNKKITFKFKGKKYTAITNKKGIAKVIIKKNVIKKLKKGKNYAVEITYLKDTIKAYVKVKK